MAVGDVDETTAGLEVVSAEEVEMRLANHVAGGHGDVFIPSEVVVAGAVLVIDAVIRVVGDGERRHRAHGVVGDVADVGREERLVLVVDEGGDVGPPEERLGERGAVVEAGAEFDERGSGAEADAVHAFEAVERVVLAHPDGARAVFLIFDVDVGGHEGAGAVVLRPVEFDAAGNPGAGKADERGLDDVVAVEEIVVVVLLVLAGVDASADLGEHDEADEFVFEPGGLVGDVLWVVIHLVDKRDGIDFSGGSLIDALVEEDRVFLGCSDGVGGDDEGFELGGDGHWVMM